VARAEPDGYTLLMATSSTLAVAPGLYKKLPYDPARDFTAISMIATVPFVLIVHPTLGVDTAKALVELVKARPGQFAYASGGLGSPHHIYAALFMHMTGTDITIVTYKGTGPLTNDLVGGHVMVGFNTLAPAIGNIQAGKLRAIAVAAPERLKGIPDVPTVAESGLPGLDIVQYYGLAAPAGTPRAIVDRLNKELRAIVTSDDVNTRFVSDGGAPMASTPEDYAANIAREEGKWAELIKKLGLKVE